MPAGAQRRRCCCGGAEAPASCDCSGCPTSVAIDVAANRRLDYDDGTTAFYLEWSYTGLSGTIATGGGCGGSPDVGDMDGSMDFEQTYDAVTEPGTGTCSLPIAEAPWSLVSLVCGPTILSPTAQSFGITTPIYRRVLLS